MVKLSLFLSVVALGGAGWAAWSAEHGRGGDDREALRAVEARLFAIERGLTELKAQPAPAVPLPGEAPAEGAPASPGLVSGGTPTLGPLLRGSPRPTATLEERLARLEKDAAGRSAGGGGRPEGAGSFADGPVFQTMPGFWPSVDAAAKELKLDGVQKSRLEGIVEGTQRDLESLYNRPNDDGVLWKDVNGGLTFEPGDASDMMGKIADHMKQVSKFRNSKVPGTNETYAEAERRIRKDGKERARSLLDADQAKTWDRSQPDALFGGPGGVGGTAAISVFSTPGDFEFVTPSR